MVIMLISQLGVPVSAAAEWSLLQTADPPPARRSHAMAYDVENDVVVVFGGFGNGSHLGDTWVLDVGTGIWKNMEPSYSPSPRAAAAMVYDSSNKRMILFGGFALGHSLVSNDTWAYSYDANTWTDLTAGSPPTERASYGMALDTRRNEIVLFGGFTERGYFNDQWIYNIEENAWRERIVQGGLPSSRGAMGFVYDTRNDVFVMFGGFSDRGFFNDTWIFDPNTGFWKSMNPASSPPPVRTRMIYDNWTGRIIFFGGDVIYQGEEEGSPEPYAKSWSYDPADNRWTELPFTNSPPARALNGIALDEKTRSLVLFGGTDTLIDNANFIGREFQDTWILDLKNIDAATYTSSELTKFVVPIGIGAAIASVLGILSLRRRAKGRSRPVPE